MNWLSKNPLRRTFRRLPPDSERPRSGSKASFYRSLRTPLARGLRLAIGPRGVALLRSVLRKNEDPLAFTYDRWVKKFDTLSEGDRRKIRSHINQFRKTPVISVVMPVYETPERALCEAIDSLINQLYPHWELCIADDASRSPAIKNLLDSYMKADSRIKCSYRSQNGHISAASNTALSLATGEYVALFDHDDVLAEHALYMVVEAIQRHPTADVFYSDEDKLNASGKRCDPHFKPDWSAELFFGQNYLNHLTIYKRSAIERVGGFRAGFEGSQDYDLALRVIASTKGPIVHIPYILYHWRIFEGAGTMSSDNLGTATDAARRALTEHFAGQGTHVTIEDVMGAFHRVVRADPPSWPKISVIIPTRDYLDILEVTIDGLRTKTDYPDLEIIIADNDSARPETLAYFVAAQKQGVQIVACPGEFNYSAINNKAIASSSGELVLLLNNDISMIEAGWLKEMARYFSDPAIGIVGPKLLYPDGTLQHAGVIVGIGGIAGHRNVGSPGEDPGRFARLALSQDLSSVTGACLLIRRSIFDEVGGLDQQDLRVAFNDIDLCLRVREAGYRIIWTPYAVLEHHESKSRGSDMSGEKQMRFQREIRVMRERWGGKLSADPFFSPNLSLKTCNTALADPPRVKKPWTV